MAGVPGALQCTSCHGASLQGQGIAPRCTQCHALPTELLNAALIGPEGGSVTLSNGPTVSVGAGALATETTISVRIARNHPLLPADAEFLGTVYDFGPDGVTFSAPVTVSFPIPSGVTDPTVFWANAWGTAFDDIGGVIAGSTIQVQVSHFTPAGVGRRGAYRVGGTVSGLAGSGLVATPGQPDLEVAAEATTFTFASPIRGGTAYSVTVLQQPSNPSQFCEVVNGIGLVGSSDVADVAVMCRSAWVKIAAGGVHTVGIRPDGTLWGGEATASANSATGRWSRRTRPC